MKISVAMATFNGARFLAEQLESLAAQTLPPHELQVGDDGSTDGTVELLRAFAARAPFPVHVQFNARNLGYGENFIQAASRCSGEWVAFCDQDDVWLPRKLERCARAIAAGGEELMLVAHDAMLTDEALNPVRPLYGYRDETLHPRMELEPDWHCLGFTQVFRRTLLTQVAPSPRPSIGWHPWKEPHDLWTAVAANALGSILLIGECLALYRRHAATVTTQAETPAAAVGTALAQVGEPYRRRAGFLAELAATFREKAVAAPAPVGDRLGDAASRIERYAGALRCRATLYDSPRRLEAIGAYANLAASGHYLGGRDWPFGAPSLAKDMVNLLLRLVRGPAGGKV